MNNFGIGSVIQIDYDKIDINNTEDHIIIKLKEIEYSFGLIHDHNFLHNTFLVSFDGIYQFITMEYLQKYFRVINSPINSKILNKKYIQLDQTN